MAKHNVDYSCGHTCVVQLYGPYTERERRIEWLEAEGLCPECYAAQRQVEREARLDAVRAAVAPVGLEPLTGSAAQIAWAEVIRARAAGELLSLIPVASPADNPGRLEAYRRLREACAAHPEARWWIDQRDVPPATVMRELSAAWLSRQSA